MKPYWAYNSKTRQYDPIPYEMFPFKHAGGRNFTTVEPGCDCATCSWVFDHTKAFDFTRIDKGITKAIHLFATLKQSVEQPESEQ